MSRVMPEPSAVLIPFPERDEDRLRLALRELEAALEAQTAALANWRGELRGLAGAVGGLEESLVQYRTVLDTTVEELLQAGDGARALERTAEVWLAAMKS